MRVLVASVAIHGVLAALLVALATRTSVPPRAPVSIEVISVPVEQPLVEPTPGPTAESTHVAAPRAEARARSPGTRRAASFVDPRGAVHVESSGDGSGTGQGDSGDGIGLGIGDASGAAALASLVPPPAPPPEPVKVSKARPAILIYPTKHGSDGDPAIFVAQVTIDDEGYVVGAHVMRGEGGSRGQQASDLIWRFRYDPARDDDGRPIRSTLEQPFLVGR